MNLLGQKSKNKGLSREKALSGVPKKLPFIKQEVKGDKLYVTVELQRPMWQRALGADKLCARSFGLDSYGQEVYQACGEDKNVKTIIDNFAEKHKISVPEAEVAVTTFLTTLMSKSLIYVEVDF